MRALMFAAALFAAGAAHADPVTYVLDPAHTQVAFSIDRFGFNRVLGQFDQVEGEVILDVLGMRGTIEPEVLAPALLTTRDLRDKLAVLTVPPPRQY